MSGREFSDEELDRLTRERQRIVLNELEQEEEMGKSIPRPPHYRDMGESPPPETKPGIPGIIVSPQDDDSPGYVPPPSFRPLACGVIVFWAAVILGIGLLYSCSAKADGMQVYLEGEDDLGNGFKLCHYSEGVTITVAATKLCPLSIAIPN
jgi:hypothetical protein